MSEKSVAELLAEMEVRHARMREERREKVRQARLTSGKELFDFERFRELYEAVGPAPDLEELSPSEAEGLERDYYLRWEKVRTLQEAAEYLYWLKERECG